MASDFGEGAGCRVQSTWLFLNLGGYPGDIVDRNNDVGA